MNPELSALGERRAAIGEPAEINVSVERIFLWLVIPLTVFYLLTINPLRDFYHGTERYLHVSYLAHLAAGGERGTLPSGFVRMAMAGRPEVLPPLYSDLLPQWRARGLEMPALAPDDRSVPRLWPLRVIALERHDRVPFRSAPNPATYSPFSYAPQVAGIFIGIIAGASPFWCLMLARIVTAALTIALGYYTLRLCPIFKWPLLLLLLLPSMCMHRVHIMPDALTVEICLFFIALVLNARVRGIAPGVRGCLTLGGSALMIGQCKSMYIGIVALAALLPAGTNKSRQRRALLTAALLGLSAASSLSWSLYTLQTYGQTEDNTFSALRAGRRLATLLQRPLEYLGNMMNQLGSLSQYRHWITNQQMWGLGHIDHFWNYLPFFTAFTVLWAFTAARRMPCDAVIVFSRNERLMCMAIAMATALLLITAVQLFDAGAHLFDGRLYAQGRYFLPLWLLVWIAIHSPALHNPQVRLCLPELCIVAVLFLHLVAATN